MTDDTGSLAQLAADMQLDAATRIPANAATLAIVPTQRN
jgi:hypothetical protein